MVRMPMPAVVERLPITREIADLFASLPTPEQILEFRPSPAVQTRATELLQRLKDGELTPEEAEELDQFQHAETLMRLVKARVRARNVP
jgi:hypothetical protein